MSKALDVYRDWLGVTETARPLNFYQLLRLKMFDDDPARVRSNYRQMNAHVRKYASGEFAPRSQKLLNELAKAMLCLTDNARKAEYDASLGRADKAGARRRTFEEILIGRKVLDMTQLDRARRYAKTVGLEIRDAVMQQKLAQPELVMQAYAESVGLPYVDLADLGVDAGLVPQVPALLARQHSCAPLMVDDGQLLIVSPNPLSPEVEDQLRLRFGMPVRTVLCAPASIHEVISKHYPREAAAAEMSAGGARPAAGPQKPAAPQRKPEPARTTPRDPAERAAAQKQQRLLAVVAFNFGFIAFAAAGMLTGYSLKLGPKFFVFAIGVGALAAAVTWAGSKLFGR